MFYLFIYFEREGEKHWLVASCTPPTGDLAHNLGMCPTRNWIGNLSVHRQAGAQSVEPHQPGLKLYTLNTCNWLQANYTSRKLLKMCAFSGWLGQRVDSIREEGNTFLIFSFTCRFPDSWTRSTTCIIGINTHLLFLTFLLIRVSSTGPSVKLGDLLLKEHNEIIKLRYDWKQTLVVTVNGHVIFYIRLSVLFYRILFCFLYRFFCFLLDIMLIVLLEKCDFFMLTKGEWGLCSP